MKIIRVILRSLGVLIILLLIAVVFLLRNVSRRAIPDYNADVVLSGITGSVEVYRDEFGIPHVYAENELDLYRVTGYLQAQDRLWQMDLLRRVTSGRLSEIFGEDMIAADQLFRSLRIPDKSRMVMAQTDSFILECIKAYSDGINQYMSVNSGKLPFEFTVLGYTPEPWEPLHSYNLIGYMSWDLTKGWNNESVLYKISRVVGEERMAELIPDLDMYDPIFPEFMLDKDLEFGNDLLSGSNVAQELGLEIFHGSNNWVVDGQHSSTGKTIVCNDMHLGIDMAPGIWYQMHQAVHGKLHVSGLVLPGAPFVICGHNDSIAWGMTNVQADAADFYLETLDPADSTRYMLDGSWRDIDIIEEQILVKGSEAVTRTNQFTHRGPVISTFKGIEDRAISMRWIGNESSNEVRTVFLLNRAGNLDDFKDAVKSFISISQNIVYGDVHGDIGLFTCGGIPLREGNRAMIMPGDTSLYDWKGILPFSRLPHEVNPDKGFLVSANNRTTGPEYSYHISHWYSLPARYNRIHELLSEKDVFTPADMADIQADQTSLWVRKFLPVMRSQLDQAELQGEALAMYNIFRDWHGNMDANLIEPTIFEAFYLKLAESVFLDELGEELYNEFLGTSQLARYAFWGLLEGRKISWTDDITTEDTEQLEDLIVRSWEAAEEWLSKTYGEDMQAWKWGDLHQISFAHPLGSVGLLDRIFNLTRGPFRVGGSFHTVSPYSYNLLVPFNSNHGASHRHIFSTSDWDESRVIIPTGISGIPASDFYCNQSDMYIRYEYMQELFSRNRVIERSLYKSTFTGE